MYKIKHTGEQVDRLLKDVFDSTLQTKDIDVTENGVIEVTPDEGYLGLAKVNVNVEVPTEGGEINDGDVMYFYDGTYYSAYLSLESGNYVGGNISNRTTSEWLNEPITKGTDEDYDITNSFAQWSSVQSTLYFNGEVKAKFIMSDGSKFDIEFWLPPGSKDYYIYHNTIPEGINDQDIHKKVLEVTNLNTNKTYTILFYKRM